MSIGICDHCGNNAKNRLYHAEIDGGDDIVLCDRCLSNSTKGLVRALLDSLKYAPHRMYRKGEERRANAHQGQRQ